MTVDLRTQRQRAGLSQAELAALTGVAQPNISAYESGRRVPSDAMTKRLTSAMTRPSDRLAARREQVKAMIERCGGLDPRVFGSVARGQDRPGSDLDIVVTVQPDAEWRFVALKRELEELLGVPVDVVSQGGLKPKHAAILAEAVPL